MADTIHFEYIMFNVECLDLSLSNEANPRRSHTHTHTIHRHTVRKRKKLASYTRTYCNSRLLFSEMINEKSKRAPRKSDLRAVFCVLEFTSVFWGGKKVGEVGREGRVDEKRLLLLIIILLLLQLTTPIMTSAFMSSYR